MIGYVLPTRNRHDRLAKTLSALGELPPHDAEVVVVDNASHAPPPAPVRLPNGIAVRLVMLPRNIGAAARNEGAARVARRRQWIVMLDDDSYPLDTAFLDALRQTPEDVGAVAAEILLPASGEHEAGGLPEVFTGCGAAIRRDLFLALGGYDRSFDYYAEEYDFCARLLLSGRRIRLDRRFRVAHHKVTRNRDMNRILRRLVRNNAWVMRRYAPDDQMWPAIRETFTRYARIARRERAAPGYTLGVGEALATLGAQERTPMPTDLWDRFTGLDAARRALRAEMENLPFRRAAVVTPGKNERVVRRALTELGVEAVHPEQNPDALVIGTMSPGPILDASERLSGDFPGHRIIAPWPGLTPAAAATPRTMVA